jgi:hypothetical protein
MSKESSQAKALGTMSNIDFRGMVRTRNAVVEEEQSSSHTAKATEKEKRTTVLGYLGGPQEASE